MSTTKQRPIQKLSPNSKFWREHPNSTILQLDLKCDPEEGETKAKEELDILAGPNSPKLKSIFGKQCFETKRHTPVWVLGFKDQAFFVSAGKRKTKFSAALPAGTTPKKAKADPKLEAVCHKFLDALAKDLKKQH